jgi:tyrosine-protein kinase
LRRLLQTLRERARIVLLGLALTLAAALIYLLTADKVYEAQADILATPVPNSQAVLSTIGVLTESGDPTLDVETAAQVVNSRAVADRAARRLGGGISGATLLDSVTVEPVPESNVVAVVAKGPSPEAAQARANAFASAAVAERRKDIRDNIDALLPRLQDDLSSASGTAAESLSSLITQLGGIRASGNATIQVEAEASPPSGPSSPHTALVLVAALLGGLGIGLAAAFAVQVLDPHLRREEQLRDLYGLPILARVPRDRSGIGPLVAGRVGQPTREAYRTLRATLVAGRERRGGLGSILVAGSGAAEGKSTTAINLAAALARPGNSVILVEADFRRPSIGKAIGVSPPQGNGIISVLLERVPLSDALVPVANLDLRLLMAEQGGTEFAELLSLPAAIRLLNEAGGLADYVVIDSPPLSEVADALQLARQVDAVLIVAKLGRSRLRKIRELGELLAANAIRPAGFVLIGVPPAREADGDQVRDDEGAPMRAARARPPAGPVTTR